jgi:hypothetical protein
MRSRGVDDRPRVTAKQVQEWLNTHRERVAVIDSGGTREALPILECVFLIDHGAVMIETAPASES